MDEEKVRDFLKYSSKKEVYDDLKTVTFVCIGFCILFVDLHLLLLKDIHKYVFLIVAIIILHLSVILSTILLYKCKTFKLYQLYLCEFFNMFLFSIIFVILGVIYLLSESCKFSIMHLILLLCLIFLSFFIIYNNEKNFKKDNSSVKRSKGISGFGFLAIVPIISGVLQKFSIDNFIKSYGVIYLIAIFFFCALISLHQAFIAKKYNFEPNDNIVDGSPV